MPLSFMMSILFVEWVRVGERGRAWAGVGGRAWRVWCWARAARAACGACGAGNAGGAGGAGGASGAGDGTGGVYWLTLFFSRICDSKAIS